MAVLVDKCSNRAELVIVGRMDLATRSSQGMDRAKSLIAIFAAKKAKLDPLDESEVALKVLESGD
jgi:hypothetical protein